MHNMLDGLRQGLVSLSLETCRQPLTFAVPLEDGARHMLHCTRRADEDFSNYEDVYVKTPEGWRFKPRTHTRAPNGTGLRRNSDESRARHGLTLGGFAIRNSSPERSGKSIRLPYLW
jgi:hypothetical protein